MWTIVAYKVTYSISLFLVSLIFTPLPLLISIPPKILSICNVFSGGVILAIGITHLLRESVEELEETIGGTWGYIFCLFGSIFTFFVEKVAFNKNKNIKDDLIMLYENYITLTQSDPRENEYSMDSPRSNSSDIDIIKEGIKIKESVGDDRPDFIPMILTLVFSIHSIIAGITLGMHQEPSVVTGIFIAIITHKWIECLSLGISMKKGTMKWNKSLTFILLYCLTIPIGIGIGSFADIWLQGKALKIATGIFLSISSGTFIFVGYIDILSVEFQQSTTKYLKFISLILGMVLATAFILYFDYDG